jgi:hypothetical protein
MWNPGLARAAAAIALAGAALTIGALDQPSASAGDGGGVVVAPSFLSQEPILIYDISGFGFGGPIHQRLTVYNSGLSSISATDFTGQSGNAAFLYSSIDRVRQLQHDLFEAGAFDLPDNPIVANDVPLTTVTVFKGNGNDQRAHSYSYFFIDTGDDPAYSEVSRLINAYIAETFPNFFSTGG